MMLVSVLVIMSLLVGKKELIEFRNNGYKPLYHLRSDIEVKNKSYMFGRNGY